MNRSLASIASIALLVALAGCSSLRPSQELVDARAAYARAYTGPAAHANTPGLHDARRALDEAEAKFTNDPGSEESRHLAYVAHRRILLAETNARSIIAATRRVQAEETLADIKARTELHDERVDDRVKARTGTGP